jgi:large repetitive protein
MKKFQYLIAFLCISTFSLAQSIQRQVINSAGGTFTNGGITLTTNIGEAVIGTISNNGITLRQGFLQPDDNDTLAAPIFNQGNLTFCQGDSVVLYTHSGIGLTFQWTFNGTTIAGATDTFLVANTNGSYRVVVSDGSNSTTSAEKIVTVNSNPTVAIQASSALTFCQGGSVTLSGSGANTYVWSNSNVNSSISVSNTGNFSVIGTDSNGCSSTSAVVSTLVNSLPVLNIQNSKGSNAICSGDSLTLTASGASSYSWNTSATTSSIIANQSGVYLVVGTDTNGCSSSDSTSITVNALPNIQINSSGSTSICSGDSLSLLASGGTTYSWSTGASSSSISVNQSGSFSVTGTDANGCSNTSNAIQVVVNALPNVSIQNSGSLSFCQGGSVTLTAVGANSYTWSNSSSNSTINVTTSGNYSVIGTDTNGCSATSNAVSILVNTPIVPTVAAVGATNVCKTNVTINSTSASSYLWSNGDTTASISASVSGSYSVTTTDSNGCQATSNSVTINKFSAVPTRPVAITGDLNPCAVIGTNNTLTYSVPADPNALSFTWLLTNGITAVGNANGNVIAVTYPAGFSSGQIRATPVNACGSGLARAIYPKTAPITTAPTFTQSVTSVCNIRGTATQATYAIQSIPGCSSYQWTLPTNATLVSGQGTTSIQVTFASAFSSGSISVLGISSCGNTPSTSITVSLLAKPVITGSNSICPGDQVTYTMPVVPGAIRYRFNLPTGLSIVSQNANSAVITNTGSFISGTLGAQVQTTLCGWSQPGSLSLNTSACRGMVGDFSLNIYPNPSRGEFQIQFGATMNDVLISVFAADGRLVKRQSLGSVETQTLYFNDVAEGLYHFEIIATDSEGKVHRKMEKMMIQR